MRRTAHISCCLVLAATSVSSVSAQDLTFELTSGQVSYQEMVSIQPTQSEWEAPFLGFGVLWTSPEWTAHGLTLRGGASFRGSSIEEETWTSGGVVSQRDDMQLEDLDLTIQIGLPVYRGPSITLKGFTGLKYGYQRFIRDEFRVADLPGAVNVRVDEVFDLVAATFGLDLSVAVSDTISLFADGAVGYVFVYEADNSAFGKVDGDDGTTFDLDTGLRWALANDQVLAFSLVYTQQDLNGNVEPRHVAGRTGVVELPDNELEYIGLRVSWTVPL